MTTNSNIERRVKVYHVDDLQQFKEDNLSNWAHNSAFWMQGKMRHLQDIWDFTCSLLTKLVEAQVYSDPPILIDVGCGEGWLLRLIKGAGLRVRYIGIDFNALFIDALKEAYPDDPMVSFMLHDIESPLPENYISSADLIVNIFNFFEVARIEDAMSNVIRCLRPSGVMLVGSIDPVMQMLAVTKTREELIDILAQYEKSSRNLAYDKDIDVGDRPSGRIYKSFFYSGALYVALARRSGLILLDFEEVVKSGNVIPQIYQFFTFGSSSTLRLEQQSRHPEQLMEPIL